VLLEGLRYDLPWWLSFLFLVVIPCLVVIVWRLDYPGTTHVTANFKVRYVELTLAEAYSMSAGIEIFGDHIDISSDSPLRIQSPSADRQLADESIGIKRTADESIESKRPDESEKTKLATLSRLDLPRDGTLSFTLRHGALMIDVKNARIEGTLTLQEDFELKMRRAGEAHVYEDLDDRKKHKMPKLRIESNHLAQLDFVPKWSDVEFLKMPISEVAFSQIADREMMGVDCFIQSGTIRLTDIDSEYQFHKGDCLNLKDFVGTLTIEGDQEDMQIGLVGDVQKITVGPWGHPDDLTPSILTVGLEDEGIQAICAVLGALLGAIGIQYYGGRI
jgi:hypothetical protein